MGNSHPLFSAPVRIILAADINRAAADGKGRLGQAPERRKESLEWETLNTCIGVSRGTFSA
jgi:hypothetical protein